MKVAVVGIGGLIHLSLGGVYSIRSVALFVAFGLLVGLAFPVK